MGTQRTKSPSSRRGHLGSTPKSGSLDEHVLGCKRLPGGVRPKELENLLDQISVARAAQLQRALSRDAWDRHTEFSDRLWNVAPVPLVVGHVSDKSRPEVVARFAALLDIEVRRQEFAFWIASGYLSRSVRGDLTVEELTLEPEHPGQGEVTPALLRAVSLAQIVARAQAALRSAPESVELADELGVAQENDAVRRDADRAAEIALAVGRRKGGRPSYPDSHYEWLARQYLALYDAGVGRGIRNELAKIASEWLGRPIPTETIRDWIRRTRELGFLEGATQGRAGARPGPNLGGDRHRVSAPSG
jgi:hypothetical protein